MRQSVKRSAAGALAIGIILALVLVVDALNGDPVSRALAERAMVAHAQKRYPGQSFTVSDRGNGMWFTYSARLQSEQSVDTAFDAQTFLGRVREDTGAMVEQRVTTQQRVSDALAEQAAQAQKDALPELALAEQYGAERAPIQVVWVYDAQTNWWSEDVAQQLTLDMPADSALLAAQPGLARMQVLTAAPTQQQLTQTLQRVKAAMETAGLPFAYYDVTLAPLSGNREEMQAGLVRSGVIKAAEIPAA